MNERDFKHSNKEKLCYCCDTIQSNDNLNEFYIRNRGYGSIFDSENFTIQLCDNCKKFVNPLWFTEECIFEDGYCEIYKYEDEIQKFIDTWIIENQEYVSNDGFLKRHHWIELKNGTLSDEKYEDYGMISPRQTRAYEERFPVCNHPINITGPGGKSCECQQRAKGDYGQKTNPDYKIKNCFLCEYYIERFEPIKEMGYNQFYRYLNYCRGKRDYLKHKSEFGE